MVILSVYTIYNFLNLFENACLIYQVMREDLQGKRILKYDEKYYIDYLSTVVDVLCGV